MVRSIEIVAVAADTLLFFERPIFEQDFSPSCLDLDRFDIFAPGILGGGDHRARRRP